MLWHSHGIHFKVEITHYKVGNQQLVHTSVQWRERERVGAKSDNRNCCLGKTIACVLWVSYTFLCGCTVFIKDRIVIIELD